MILSERGLARAIKRAYPGAGYTVLNLGEELVIYTDGWFVKCAWPKLPRKALALLVEHIGFIPAQGDALAVEKGAEPQITMADVVGDDIAAWMDGVEENDFAGWAEGTAEPAGAVMFAPVVFNGLAILQEPGGGKCYGANPDSLGLVEADVYGMAPGRLLNGSRASWSHDGETAVMNLFRAQAGVWGAKWEVDVWAALEGVDLHRKA